MRILGPTCNQFLHMRQQWPLIAKQAAADSLRLTIEKIKRYSQRLASSCLYVDRLYLYEEETWLQRQDVYDILQELEYDTNDETPLHCGVEVVQHVRWCAFVGLRAP